MEVKQGRGSRIRKDLVPGRGLKGPSGRSAVGVREWLRSIPAGSRERLIYMATACFSSPACGGGVGKDASRASALLRP